MRMRSAGGVRGENGGTTWDAQTLSFRKDHGPVVLVLRAMLFFQK